MLEKLIFPAIRSYSCQIATDFFSIPRTFHTYIICEITSGRGVAVVNGTPLTVKKGDLFYVQPGMTIEGKFGSEQAIHVSIIMFRAIMLHKENRNWSVSQPKFPFPAKLDISSQAISIHDAILYFIKRESPHRSDRFTKSRKLSNLLHAVASLNSTQGEGDPQGVLGMERTLAYIAQNYSKEMRIEHLAKMAGFSMNHFTRSFKHQMNMTPTEYIVKQRISKAKQLLFSSKKAKEVAEQVGYKDEHYFSRAFKKVEGVAPTLYIKNKCHRIAALYYGIDDHLLTLGLTPVAALSYKERVSYSYPLPELSGDIENKFKLDSRKSNYEKLMRSKPDMMLTSDRLLQDDSLNQIAPTAVLAHSNQYGQMLEQMAKILGRERQAADWVERYREQMTVIKQNINTRWGTPSVAFIRVSPHFYRVYGAGNQTGALLYDDLALHLPKGFPNREWAKDIQLEEVASFHADHIFIMTDPTDEARQRLQLLLRSEQWTSLEAVRHQRVYEAGDMFFKALGPTGRMWAIDYVASQLRG
ncbi:AraC family transcriptional regulator [Paenibacillus endophyticus]